MSGRVLPAITDRLDDGSPQVCSDPKRAVAKPDGGCASKSGQIHLLRTKLHANRCAMNR